MMTELIQRKTPVRVFITQTCDVGNKGDQGILKSELALIRKLFPHSEISVATWWSKDLLKKIEPEVSIYSPLVDFKIKGKEVPLVFYPLILVLSFFLSVISALSIRFSIPPLYRGSYLHALKNSDLVISSGHQPFSEGSMYLKKNHFYSVANFLVMLWGAMDILIAKKIFSRRFATFPQSVGPFNTFFGRLLARFIFGNMDVVCVRENISKKTLNELGIKTPVCSIIDMGFFFDPPFLQDVSFPAPLIGVSPCFVAGMSSKGKDTYVSILSEALQKLQKKYGVTIVLLSSQTSKGKAMAISGNEDDYSVSRLIESALNKMGLTEFEVKNVHTESVDTFVNVLRCLDMLIATRMHPSIFAAGQAVPFVEIIYEHKQVGLLENLQLSEVGININGLSIENLLLKTDYVWENKIALRNHLRERISILRSRDRPVMERVVSALITA